MTLLGPISADFRQIEDLRAKGLNAVEVSATQSKETRAHIQTPTFEAKRVHLPETAPWLSELESELLAFPSVRHNDQVDSITQAPAYEQVEKGGVDFIYIDWRPRYTGPYGL